MMLYCQPIQTPVNRLALTLRPALPATALGPAILLYERQDRRIQQPIGESLNEVKQIA